jgi:hypothetical protein
LFNPEFAALLIMLQGMKIKDGSPPVVVGVKVAEKPLKEPILAGRMKVSK